MWAVSALACAGWVCTRVGEQGHTSIPSPSSVVHSDFSWRLKTSTKGMKERKAEACPTANNSLILEEGMPIVGL